MSHAQHARVLERVGANGVRNDSAAAAGVLRFENHRAGAVGVDERIAIVRIGDARQRVGADDHRAFDVAGADHRIGVNDALQPAGTSEDEIDRRRVRILDFEMRLHARGEGGNEIGVTHFPGANVAEVVRDDDRVERLAVDAGRVERVARRDRRDVGGDDVVMNVATLADSGDGLELLEDFLI